MSQRKRKPIEELFGWEKTAGEIRLLRHGGTALVEWVLTFAWTAFNLVRLRRLLAAQSSAGRRAGGSAAPMTVREASDGRPQARDLAPATPSP